MSQAAASAHSLATLPSLLTAVSGPAASVNNSTGPGLNGAVLLSSALPPITAKLAAKISLGQFVAMKELLADNMTLCHQLDVFPAQQHMFAGTARPRLREID